MFKQKYYLNCLFVFKFKYECRCFIPVSSEISTSVECQRLSNKYDCIWCLRVRHTSVTYVSFFFLWLAHRRSHSTEVFNVGLVFIHTDYNQFRQQLFLGEWNELRATCTILEHNSISRRADTMAQYLTTVLTSSKMISEVLENVTSQDVYQKLLRSQLHNPAVITKYVFRRPKFIVHVLAGTGTTWHYGLCWRRGYVLCFMLCHALH